MSIAAFLSEIEARLKTGQATEHTDCSTLESRFNAVLSPAKATNEPKQAGYGAPDFIIQQGNAPSGHAEVKDVGLDLDCRQRTVLRCPHAPAPVQRSAAQSVEIPGTQYPAHAGNRQPHYSCETV